MTLPTPFDLSIVTLSQLEDFWSRIDKTSGHGPEGECWLWDGVTNKKGYGSRHIGLFQKRTLRRVLVHRIAWMLDNPNENLGTRYLRHTCDVPRCVNPAHLILGSIADNNRDMAKRGRASQGNSHWARRYPDRVPKGECRSHSKLTNSLVRYVRRSAKTGRELAKELGVGETCVSRVRSRKTWKHVK